MLTPSPRDKAGHLRVTLSLGGKRISTDVAPLIARTWIGECPPGHEVCHGPAGPSRNDPDNLSYGTRKKNSRDRLRDGTWMGGEANGLAKLTWAAVAEIRRRYPGETQKVLAHEYGVSDAAIRAVVKNRTWVQAASGRSSSY